jgi:HEAT repeat protein
MGPAAKEAEPALRKALKDENENVRSEVAHALGRVSVDSVAILIEGLRDEHPRARLGAGFGLREIGPYAKEACTPLVEMLKEPRESMQLLAIGVLGSLEDRAAPAVEGLLPLLKSASPGVAEATILSLGMIGPDAKGAVPVLQQQAEQVEDIEVRLRALSTLADIGPGAKAAQPVVLKALKDIYAPTRCMAAQAIWRIEGNGKTAVPVLLAELKDPNDYFRVEAAFNLSLLGADAREAVKEIRPALKDPYARVRIKIALCLLQIDPKDREAAQVFLADIPSAGVPQFQPLTRLKYFRQLAELAHAHPQARIILRSLMQGEPDRVWKDLGEVLKKMEIQP